MLIHKLKVFGIAFFFFGYSVVGFAAEVDKSAAMKKQLEEHEKFEPPKGNGSNVNQQLDPQNAIVADGIESEKIPEVPGQFKPFEKNMETPEQREFRLRVLNQMWSTPLGQMFLHYLKNTDPAIEQPNYSRQLVHRMYADSTQAGTRVAAINLLVSDLYVKGEITPEMQHRIMILQGDIQQLNESGAGHTKSVAVMHATLFLLAALPFAYKPFREKTKELLKTKVGEPIVKRLPAGLVAFGSKYQLSPVWQTFINTFGPYSMFYYMYYEWSTALLGEQTRDSALLNGLDTFIKTLQF